MENKHYICKHNTGCRYSRDKRCVFGSSISETLLKRMYGGTFDPRLAVLCDHPEVRTGVLLIEIKHDHIEGSYRSIWTQ